MANSVDLDEMAHTEPPHQDLRCLQIQLCLSWVLNELNYEIAYDHPWIKKMKNMILLFIL